MTIVKYCDVKRSQYTFMHKALEMAGRKAGRVNYPIKPIDEIINYSSKLFPNSEEKVTRCCSTRSRWWSKHMAGNILSSFRETVHPINQLKRWSSGMTSLDAEDLDIVRLMTEIGRHWNSSRDMCFFMWCEKNSENPRSNHARPEIP